MITRKLIGTNLDITQEKGNAFNLDTVLLADFIDLNKSVKKIIDFGTGNGGLLLYLSLQTKAALIGLEVQKQRVLLANHNVQINNLQNQIKIIEVDINNYKEDGFADIVISNPPFFKYHDMKRININEDASIARHEVLIDLHTLINKMCQMLNNKGKLFMIHRPERLEEIMIALKNNKMSIKKLRFVHPYHNSSANHVLIEAQKTLKCGIIVVEPLILYDNKHEISQELHEIYGGRKYVTSGVK